MGLIEMVVVGKQNLLVEASKGLEVLPLVGHLVGRKEAVFFSTAYQHIESVLHKVCCCTLPLGKIDQ